MLVYLICHVFMLNHGKSWYEEINEREIKRKSKKKILIFYVFYFQSKRIHVSGTFSENENFLHVTSSYVRYEYI